MSESQAPQLVDRVIGVISGAVLKGQQCLGDHISSITED